MLLVRICRGKSDTIETFEEKAEENHLTVSWFLDFILKITCLSLKIKSL